MTDLDLPPTSPLPDGVRDTALIRLREGFDTPPPRRLPLKVAAVVVAVATATTLALQFTDRADPTVTTTSDSELPLQDAGRYYDLRTGSAPDGAAERCQAARTDLPAPAQWTPLATASRFRVDLMAFETPAGAVFCETTPWSVTVSTTQTDPGELAVTFTTATGSMAGFVGHDTLPFTLVPRVGQMPPSVDIGRVGRLFLMPNGFVADGVTTLSNVDPSLGSDSPFQTFELTTPPHSPTVVDRPGTPEDRDSPEGRRLGECVVDQQRPVPDPAAWRAGQSVALSATESLQLGHYGDLLLLCAENRHVTMHDLARIDDEPWFGSPVLGRTVRGVPITYGFDRAPRDGGDVTASLTQGFVLEVTDPAVATVTLTGPGGLDITAQPVAGSVVLKDLTYPGSGSGEVRFTVRDAAGTVLEEITRGS